LNDPNGTVLRTKGFQVIPKGRRLLLKLPGGGGMGDPKARDPELVKRDVADGLITPQAAREIYGV
jgi:N-methylhydantoinase B